MIDYFFDFHPNHAIHFQIDLKRKLRPKKAGKALPDWTKLDFKKCPNCTLTLEEHPTCPAAADIQGIVECFSNVPSINVVKIRVKTPEREFHKECDIQTGLNSLFGVVLASGSCPVLSQLGSLATFHLPFATIDETIYRTTGNHLLRQYLRKQHGEPADFDLKELENLYQQLEVVNESITARVQGLCQQDAVLNAFVNFAALSLIIKSSIQESLENLHRYFS